MESGTIIESREFENELRKHGHLIVFVHSPWSGYSKMGLQKFRSIMERLPDIHWIVIDNMSGNSFVYDWLLGQSGKQVIHGNGEFFEVREGVLQWFVSSSYLATKDEIEEKVCSGLI